MSGWKPGNAPYYPVDGPAPGPTPNYAPNYPPQGAYGQPAYGQGEYGGGYSDQKDPYAGERFKPKKRINDPIFLILFIAQVRSMPARSSRPSPDSWVAGCSSLVSSSSQSSRSRNSQVLVGSAAAWARAQPALVLLWTCMWLQVVLPALCKCLRENLQPYRISPPLRHGSCTPAVCRLSDPHAYVHESNNAHHLGSLHPAQHVRNLSSQYKTLTHQSTPISLFF